MTNHQTAIQAPEEVHYQQYNGMLLGSSQLQHHFARLMSIEFLQVCLLTRICFRC